MKISKNNLLAVGLIIVLAVVIGLFKNGQPGSDKKLQVTTSFYPLWYFATQIGGDKADVKSITPVGIEPHDYEPTSQDIARIEKSSLLILNGGVEAWGDKIKANLKDKNVSIVVAGEGLLTKDPHIWLDPKLAKKEAEKITGGYVKVDPSNGQYYQDNQKKLAERFDQLDERFQQGLQNCKSRDILTSHEAFTYLADAYGLNQVAISGLSPDEEPSAQQLAEVADFAKKNNVKYIFSESLVSPKFSETLANEVGAKTLALDPIEGIPDDDIKQGRNYFTVMEDNLRNLRTALECN